MTTTATTSPDASERRQLPPALAALLAELVAAGYTADSPPALDAEGERLAREERWN